MMSQTGEERSSNGGINEVIALARSGDRNGARRRVLELLQHNPNDTVALLWLAYTSDDVTEVEHVLKQVLVLEPDNQKALEWQNLIQQKSARPKAGLPGPTLKPGPRYIQPEAYPPGIIPTASVTSMPQTYQPLAGPTQSQNAQYRVMIEPGPNFSPAYPYVQSTPLRRKWWPIALIGGLVVLVLVATLLFLVATGRSRSNAALSDYRLFTTLDDLSNEGFVDERVAIERRFLGGYTKDPQGTYLLVYTEGKTTLYIQWHESVTSISDFRPGQFITIYGRLTGIGGGKGTLRVDKVTPTVS